MDLSHLSLPLLFITSIIAGAVAAVSGFGIGSLMTPLLLLWYPPHWAVALVAIPHALASVLRWLRLRKDVVRRVFLQFGVASAVGGLLGALLQASLRSALLAVLLGVLMIVAGVTEMSRRPIPLPEGRAARLIAGTLSGFFGGLVGNQGGIRSAALLGFGLSPRQLVATATASAVLVDLARLPVYLAARGAMLAAEIPLIMTASVGVIIGTFVGVPILGRIPAKAYRPLVGTLLVLLGVSLLAAAR